MLFNHALLAWRSRQPKYICSQKGFFGDKKYSFPTCLTARQVGMLVVGGSICYKACHGLAMDSTRQGGLKKSHRDLIFVTKEQNSKKNPIGIQCFLILR